MTTISTTESRIKLRPDIERIVDGLILRAVGLDRRGKLTAYADAKRILSRACGWDARPFARDDDLYNRAVSRFVRGIQL